MVDTDPSDEEVIRRALRAAVDGPYFVDAEFHTLFGLTRNELRLVLDAWPQAPHVGVPDGEGAADVQRVGVNNALNNLLGFPHGHDRRLVEDVGADKRELALVFERWRGERFDPSGRSYFGDMM